MSSSNFGKELTDFLTSSRIMPTYYLNYDETPNTLQLTMNQSPHRWLFIAWEVKWKVKKILGVVFICLRTFPSPSIKKSMKSFHLRWKGVDAHSEMSLTELFSVTGQHTSVNYSYVSTQDQMHTLLINQCTSDLLQLCLFDPDSMCLPKVSYENKNISSMEKVVTF